MAASDTSRQAPAKAPAASIDPGSDAILLAYRDGPVGYGVPARDLHGNDLARIVRVRALSASDGQPVEPATAEQLTALYEELLASGTFSASVAPPAELEADPASPTAPTWSPADKPDATPGVPALEA